MLDSLFSHIKIEGRTLKNRCVVPAMASNYCNEDGTCTERFAAYHEAKAKGGFGMIITENFAVRPRGRGFRQLPGLWNDGQIEGFRKCTERVHKYGAVFIAQIYHAGRQTSVAATGEIPEAPTAIRCPFGMEIPEELTVEEIGKIVTDFGDAARRAEQAGFDGVEVHGAHGYLIAQFMSPYSNKRTDMYGGSLTNRLRFPMEILRDVRRKVSRNFIVGFRISGDEFVTGGRTIEDTKAIVQLLEAEGVSYFHVSAGVYRSFDAVIPSMYTPHGWIADHAKEVREVTKVPVIAVGRINDPFVADEIIRSKKADLVAMGRQSLADPETPNKARAGRLDDIRTCIGCHRGCVGNLMANLPITCMLNPTAGHEFELKEVRAPVPKKVMVIGAGPAGLQAAITAAQSGHKVSVYDRRRWAGGQFRLGAVTAAKGEIVNFINWQLHTLAGLKVPVYMNTEVTEEIVGEQAPDVIVAATGAKPVIPANIPGSGGKNVVTAHDVLEGRADTGYRVVVIGGGGVGAETANHLSTYLKEVTLVEMLPEIAADEMTVPKWGLLAELEKNHVRVLTDTTVLEIRDSSVIVSRRTEEEIHCDTVVLAVGSRPDDTFAERLASLGYDVRIIGDATHAGFADKAISDGFELGRSL